MGLFIGLLIGYLTVGAMLATIRMTLEPTDNIVVWFIKITVAWPYYEYKNWRKCRGDRE